MADHIKQMYLSIKKPISFNEVYKCYVKIFRSLRRYLKKILFFNLHGSIFFSYFTERRADFNENCYNLNCPSWISYFGFNIKRYMGAKIIIKNINHS
jgi:hypothetical protein